MKTSRLKDVVRLEGIPRSLLHKVYVEFFPLLSSWTAISHRRKDKACLFPGLESPHDPQTKKD